jgi:DNA-binding NtrC family response regulator/tetratricopeptide (TPR) repeat protein
MQRSVFRASRSRDIERMGWSQLRLWLMLANRADFDAATVVLAEARDLAFRLGDPSLLAAFHVAVSELDAKRGLLRTAGKHAASAMRLLAEHPNCWLEAWAENVQLAIALTESDLDLGLEHGHRAVALAEDSGVAVTLRACLANLGNVMYLRGRFDEAFELFRRSLAALPSSGENGCGPIDAMAWVRITQGLPEQADALLDQIDQAVRSDADRGLYVFRYALLTRVHSLLRQQRWSLAVSHAEALERTARNAHDSLLEAHSILCRAQALSRLGHVTESLELAAGIARDILGLPPSLFARYEMCLATAAAMRNEREAAGIHYRRASLVYACLHNVPGEMDLEWDWQTMGDPGEHGAQAPRSQACKRVAQSVGALMAYPRSPQFTARELLCLLEDVDCVESAKVAEEVDDETIVMDEIGSGSVSAQEERLYAGRSGNRTVEVWASPRKDVESVAAMNAIRIVLAGVSELEAARASLQDQLALWPVEDVPIEGEHAVLTGRMLELMTFARRVARTNVSVLITGESGTGKEILARAIHGYSARADKPFIPFNCTAIPHEMLESQLFGHRRGAFTGAERDHPGLIRTAKDGTLFLDEIGELNIDLQPKLLRFLESGEINPLGEPSPFNVDVRIIAATNSNLEQLVQDQRFREDLFYRLNVIRLTIPPLRERRDEIPPLVHHFVARAATEFSKGHVRVAEETMEHLLLFPWPGNVRQLNNELRRMVALAENDAVLSPSALSPAIRRATAKPPARTTAGLEMSIPLTEKLAPTIARIEREMIRVALRAHQGHVDQAAKALGISRKGLYLKRQRLGV